MEATKVSPVAGPPGRGPQPAISDATTEAAPGVPAFRRLEHEADAPRARHLPVSFPADNVVHTLLPKCSDENRYDAADMTARPDPPGAHDQPGDTQQPRLRE
jgi:hypothetical protein